MAKALTFRKLAKLAQKESDNYNRLASLQYDVANAMPQTNQSPAADLIAANAAWDQALKYNNMSDAYQTQADNYTQAANDAGEPP
jgi:hypothetical protein